MIIIPSIPHIQGNISSRQGCGYGYPVELTRIRTRPLRKTRSGPCKTTPNGSDQITFTIIFFSIQDKIYKSQYRLIFYYNLSQLMLQKSSILERFGFLIFRPDLETFFLKNSDPVLSFTKDGSDQKPRFGSGSATLGIRGNLDLPDAFHSNFTANHKQASTIVGTMSFLPAILIQ